MENQKNQMNQQKHLEHADQTDGYGLTPLKSLFEVTHLISAHYFEYAKDFCFTGESHDFWEFLYVDKGQVIVDAGDKRYTLKQGQFILHAPNEWHTVSSDGNIAPNLIVMSFQLTGEALNALEGLVLRADAYMKRILVELVEESTQCFSDDLSDYRLMCLTPSDLAPYGSLQMLKCLLEQLLIYLCRIHRLPSAPLVATAIQVSDQDQQLQRITQAIQGQMHQKITLQSLSKTTSLSSSTMARCIKKTQHTTVMTYVERQKMTYVKERMREGEYHLDELARLVGYLSVSHLGRVFKKHMDMTLTEYLKRLKR
jgi:AraC-like DNA-binding protein/quercetin dioxygenase-like cupin family protein